MTTETTATVEIPPRLDLGRHVAGPVFQALLRFSQAAEGQARVPPGQYTPGQQA
jgi:hypothetical protein